MTSNNFAIKAKRIRNIYYIVGAFMLAQQLYYPAGYKYFHLPLLFLTLITADLYEFKYRNYEEEYKILGSLFICSLIAILDRYINIDVKIIYYAFLAVGIYFNYKLMNYTQMTFSSKSEKKRINNRNIKLYRGNGKFMRIYCRIIKVILIVSVAYIILDIVGLITL